MGTPDSPRPDQTEAAAYEGRRHAFDGIAGWGVSLVLHAVLLVAFTGVTWVTGGAIPGVGPEEIEAGVVSDEEVPSIEPGKAGPIEVAGSEARLLVPELNTSTKIEQIAGIGKTPSTSTDTEALIALDMGASPASAVTGDWGTLAGTGAVGGGEGDWNSVVRNLRRRGLDIVLTFDSTGSMGGEIRAVKTQIKDIGEKLKKLIPRTRIGICTYRDRGDLYVVRGLPLTDNIQKVQMFLNTVRAGGGGDRPEAVLAALQWSIAKNRFRRTARKVIIIFGDAPPHERDIRECMRLAQLFQRQYRGIVSTVTCGRGGVAVYGGKLSSFVRIAQAGSGEAFLTTDHRRIMEQLIVLVFGSKHKDKVEEVFK